MKANKKLTYGIKRQLFLFSAAIILVLLLIIGIVFAATAGRTLADLAIANHAQSARQMLTDFQRGTVSLSNLTQNYLNSPYFQDALSSSELSYQSEKYLISSLYNPNNSYLDYCFYINNDNSLYASSPQAQEDLDNPDLMEHFNRLAEPTYSRPLLTSAGSHAPANASIYMVRRIRHLSINRPPGLLVLHVGPDFYSNVFANIDMPEGCSYFLLDSTFTAAYSRDSGTIPAPALAYLRENFDAGSSAPYIYDNVYYFAVPDEATGFTIVSGIPRDVMLASSNTFFKTILLLLLCAVILSIPLVLLMSGHFTRPIRQLADTMNDFSIDSLGQPLQIRTNTELDMISGGYNQMLENIQKLLETVAHDQEQLRANEYSLLLHQINPHFLYNTLDNIHMLSRLNGDEKTVSLICALSSYLRISLSKGHEMIPVAEELLHIESYLTIEQLRTEGLFTYTIAAAPEIRDYPIPKLIIQPLVENAIKYGFAELDEGGELGVRVTHTDNRMFLTVQNNGTPIDAETMAVLNRMPFLPLAEIPEAFPARPGGYGVANVVCRLKLRYENDFTMVYEAANGTCCTISLPAELSPL